MHEESRRSAAESAGAASADPQELLECCVSRIEAAKRAEGKVIRLQDEEIAYDSALIKEVEAALAAKRTDSYTYRPPCGEKKIRRPAARGVRRRQQ